MTDLRHHPNVNLRLAVQCARDAAKATDPEDFAAHMRNAMSFLNDVPLAIMLPEAQAPDLTHAAL